ncbi:MAG: hypothetical protein MH252_00325 [Thermosynechococcaceae cyanobacterium MS004]|nr:hypothetical protein [Thermosynechococcaceae cyanobacterium MS004]
MQTLLPPTGGEGAGQFAAGFLCVVAERRSQAECTSACDRFGWKDNSVA